MNDIIKKSLLFFAVSTLLCVSGCMVRSHRDDEDNHDTQFERQTDLYAALKDCINKSKNCPVADLLKAQGGNLTATLGKPLEEYIVKSDRYSSSSMLNPDGGLTMVQAAATNGDNELLKKLLKAVPGFDVDFVPPPQKNKNTALSLAAESNNREGVSLLLKHGAKPALGYGFKGKLDSYFSSLNSALKKDDSSDIGIFKELLDNFDRGPTGKESDEVRKLLSEELSGNNDKIPQLEKKVAYFLEKKGFQASTDKETLKNFEWLTKITDKRLKDKLLDAAEKLSQHIPFEKIEAALKYSNKELAADLEKKLGIDIKRKEKIEQENKKKLEEEKELKEFNELKAKRENWERLEEWLPENPEKVKEEFAKLSKEEKMELAKTFDKRVLSVRISKSPVKDLDKLRSNTEFFEKVLQEFSKDEQLLLDSLDPKYFRDSISSNRSVEQVIHLLSRSQDQLNKDIKDITEKLQKFEREEQDEKRKEWANEFAKLDVNQMANRLTSASREPEWYLTLDKAVDQYIEKLEEKTDFTKNDMLDYRAPGQVRTKVLLAISKKWPTQEVFDEDDKDKPLKHRTAFQELVGSYGAEDVLKRLIQDKDEEATKKYIESLDLTNIKNLPYPYARSVEVLKLLEELAGTTALKGDCKEKGVSPVTCALDNYTNSKVIMALIDDGARVSKNEFGVLSTKWSAKDTFNDDDLALITKLFKHGASIVGRDAQGEVEGRKDISLAVAFIIYETKALQLLLDLAKEKGVLKEFIDERSGAGNLSPIEHGLEIIKSWQSLRRTTATKIEPIFSNLVLLYKAGARASEEFFKKRQGKGLGLRGFYKEVEQEAKK